MHFLKFRKLLLSTTLLISSTCFAEDKIPQPTQETYTDSNFAAVCDFIYARLLDAQARIANLPPEKPPIQRIPTADGSTLYQFKNDAVSIDFYIVDGVKKILTARFYATGLLEVDRRKEALLSRLGVRHPGKTTRFVNGCDAANVEISFSGSKLMQAKIFFYSE